MEAMFLKNGKFIPEVFIFVFFNSSEVQQWKWLIVLSWLFVGIDFNFCIFLM